MYSYYLLSLEDDSLSWSFAVFYFFLFQHPSFLPFCRNNYFFVNVSVDLGIHVIYLVVCLVVVAVPQPAVIGQTIIFERRVKIVYHLEQRCSVTEVVFDELTKHA